MRGTLITGGLASIGLTAALGFEAFWLGSGLAGILQHGRATSASRTTHRTESAVVLFMGAGTVGCELGSVYLLGTGCRVLVIKPKEEE